MPNVPVLVPNPGSDWASVGYWAGSAGSTLEGQRGPCGSTGDRWGDQPADHEARAHALPSPESMPPVAVMTLGAGELERLLGDRGSASPGVTGPSGALSLTLSPVVDDDTSSEVSLDLLDPGWVSDSAAAVAEMEEDPTYGQLPLADRRPWLPGWSEDLWEVVDIWADIEPPLEEDDAVPFEIPPPPASPPPALEPVPTPSTATPAPTGVTIRPPPVRPLAPVQRSRGPTPAPSLGLRLDEVPLGGYAPNRGLTLRPLGGPSRPVYPRPAPHNPYRR